MEIYKYIGGSLYNETVGERAEWIIDNKWLNEEIEIIEEPQEHKIPEKLGVCAYEEGEIAYSWSKSEALLKTKINEILDYLEEIK